MKEMQLQISHGDIQAITHTYTHTHMHIHSLRSFVRVTNQKDLYFAFSCDYFPCTTNNFNLFHSHVRGLLLRFSSFTVIRS